MKYPPGFRKIKPWEVEFDQYVWNSSYSNRPCLVIRNTIFNSRKNNGTFCGYVACNPNNPLYKGEGYTKVHGGITYQGDIDFDTSTPLHSDETTLPVVGFDAAHYMDYRPGISISLKYERYRTAKYMIIECQKLACELDKFANKENITIPAFDI